MPIKTEIERRLRKRDCKKLPGLIEIESSYDSVRDSEYLKNMLKIADAYGNKYRIFYKLKDDIDIRTLTSNIDEKPYEPNLDHEANGTCLRVSYVFKSDSGFEIMADFYTHEEDWDTSPDGMTKTRVYIWRRRVMRLKKNENSSFMVLSIDPIGEGEKIGREVPGYLEQITDAISAPIMDFFDIKDIDEAFFLLVDDGVITPQRVKAYDNETARVREVVSTNPEDDISDETVYSNAKNGVTEARRLKFKYGKDGLELFGKTLVKSTTKMDWEKSDELEEAIVRLLQQQQPG
ncbi:hypothetical protein [Hydrogenimonas sp.]